MHSLNLYSHNAIQHMGFWNESFYNALDQAELVKYIKFKLFFFFINFSAIFIISAISIFLVISEFFINICYVSCFYALCVVIFKRFSKFELIIFKYRNLGCFYAFYAITFKTFFFLVFIPQHF